MKLVVMMHLTHIPTGLPARLVGLSQVAGAIRWGADPNPGTAYHSYYSHEDLRRYFKPR